MKKQYIFCFLFLSNCCSIDSSCKISSPSSDNEYYKLIYYGPYRNSNDGYDVVIKLCINPKGKILLEKYKSFDVNLEELLLNSKSETTELDFGNYIRVYAYVPYSNYNPVRQDRFVAVTAVCVSARNINDFLKFNPKISYKVSAPIEDNKDLFIEHCSLRGAPLI